LEWNKDVTTEGTESQLWHQPVLQYCSVRMLLLSAHFLAVSRSPHRFGIIRHYPQQLRSENTKFVFIYIYPCLQSWDQCQCYNPIKFVLSADSAQ
jgi:hypothetical protein